MRTPILLPILLLLSAVCPGADESLIHARRAQALLGSEVWSQVIRVENTARASKYPRTLHALVFELEGILWFYSDVDGTQSFSLHRGRVEEERKNFVPLLRDIERGFERWAVLEGDPVGASWETAGADLPNGCFIESYAALRMLVARGAAVSAPRLLSYYGNSSFRQQGHTVLAYLEAGRVVVVDPVRPDVKMRFPASLAADPRALARAVQGPEVKQAQVLPLALPVRLGQREVFAANGTGAVQLLQ